MTALRTGRNLYRVFVGNLPWTIGNKELRNYFQAYGRVAGASVIFDRKTGLSRGYGFVNFFNLTPIEKIENEPRHLLDGNQLKILKN